jgi:hypothetical protein
MLCITCLIHFLLLGCSVLDNGRKFGNQVMSELCSTWDGVKLCLGSHVLAKLKALREGPVKLCLLFGCNPVHNQRSEDFKWESTSISEISHQTLYEAVFGNKVKRDYQHCPFLKNRHWSQIAAWSYASNVC